MDGSKKKLTAAEQKRLNDAYAMQKTLLQLSDKDELPKEIKRTVRDVTLKMIFAAREAKAAKTLRTREYRAAEETFKWQPARRR